MSETKFTKGVWEVNTLAGRPYRKVFSDDDSLIADTGVGGLPTDEIEANAKLISAAPDMYEALLQIQEWLLEKGPFVDDGITHPLFIKANNVTQAALAKATH